MSQDESIQRRHLRIYTLLCQLIIAIITFYCAIAISHYEPTPASAVPRAVAPRTPFSDANSITWYICKTDDLGAILIAITPYSVLSFFLLSLISFVFGIFIFNSLHPDDIDLIDGYSYFIIAGVLSLDWENVLTSLRVTMLIEPGDILEIQASGKVAEGGVVENNRLPRRNSGRY